jgi:hypothetical protein
MVASREAIVRRRRCSFPLSAGLARGAQAWASVRQAPHRSGTSIHGSRIQSLCMSGRRWRARRDEPLHRLGKPMAVASIVISMVGVAGCGSGQTTRSESSNRTSHPRTTSTTAVVAKRARGLNSFLLSPVDDSALTEGKRHRERSARAFAGGGNDPTSRAAAALVAADGFVESEDETFTGQSGDPVGFSGAGGYSNVIKFTSAAGARRYLADYVAAGRPRPQIRVSRFSIPGVPSATGTAWVNPLTRATTTNVFWISGRCLVHVGEGSAAHFSLKAFESTWSAVAKSIYDRSNGQCT